MTTRPAMRRLPLLGLAVFAFGWIVARACIQSVVLDEADSYFNFAASSWPDAAFYPSSGNHVLNTLLIRFFTSLFGLNELTLRTPAIVGAAVYIASAFYLCVLLTERKLLQCLLFICLVYNPFVLDYLVAARGYSLAIGCFLAAIAIVAHAIVAPHADRPAYVRLCAAASLFVALSFSANFSFAIVDGIAILLFFLWAAWQRKGKYATLAAASFLPGLSVVALVCGRTLWRWPQGQFYFGATSLAETWSGIVAASFSDLPPAIYKLHPALDEWSRGYSIIRTKQALALLTVILTLALFASLAIDRPRWRSLAAGKLFTLTGFMAILLVSTLLVHWLAFHTLGLLLPKNRTALFVAPLFTLVLGGTLAIRFQLPDRDLLRSCGTGILMVLAVYFLGCLRLSYFSEWRYNADAKHLYWILNDLNRRCGISDFVTEWRYVGPLNFYRTSYRNNSMQQFVSAGRGDSYRTDGRAYILYYADAASFIQRQHLKVLYHDDRTGAVVAVRPCDDR